MKGFWAAMATVLATTAQVTVAPLFPVAGTTPDFVLLTLILLTYFGSPRWAMACVPAAALGLGFLADRSPGLLILAYMPLLPLAYYVEDARVPMNHFARTLIVMLATGGWVRLLFVIAAVVGGADASAGVFAGKVLLPGLFVDFALLSVVYVPFRLIGWSGQGMSLSRGTYYSSL